MTQDTLTQEAIDEDLQYRRATEEFEAIQETFESLDDKLLMQMKKGCKKGYHIIRYVTWDLPPTLRCPKINDWNIIQNDVDGTLAACGLHHPGFLNAEEFAEFLESNGYTSDPSDWDPYIMGMIGESLNLKPGEKPSDYLLAPERYTDPDDEYCYIYFRDGCEGFVRNMAFL